MGGATWLFTLLTSTTSSSPLLLPHHRQCPALLRLACRHRRRQLSFSSIPHRIRCSHNLQSSTPSLPPSFRAKSSRQFYAQATFAGQSSNSSHQPPPVFHQWPEWSNFLQNISALGYFNRQVIDSEIEEFVDPTNLPDEFVRTTIACLAFGRDRPEILGLLSRRDIATVITNGMPLLLFKNGEELVRRMQLFLDGQSRNVPSTDRAQTVDLMKLLVTYAGNVMPFGNMNIDSKQEVELSVRNILGQLSQFSYNSIPSFQPSPAARNQFLERNVPGPSPVGPNVEMKKGDWICSRCNFMNFARNIKCLDCEEARPKRQLTGGEWECPECDYFNYGRNMVCIRCDCKRPGEVSLRTMGSGPGLESGYGTQSNGGDIDNRLAANEEKAQRWFSKMSQMDNSSDINSAIPDEDFPEIMPLRKGGNMFNVSTRKTPLERRLSNAQNQKALGNDSNRLQPTDNFRPPASSTGEQSVFEDKQGDNSDSWFKKVAELHNVADVDSALADVDFPDIMPMRKGENRFVVPKKKDRSLTSPLYKRRAAMEQANDTNYVPFVPFPPNYFAKKVDQQQQSGQGSANMAIETPNSSTPESSASYPGPGFSDAARVPGLMGAQQPSTLTPPDQNLNSAGSRSQPSGWNPENQGGNPRTGVSNSASVHGFENQPNFIGAQQSSTQIPPNMNLSGNRGQPTRWTPESSGSNPRPGASNAASTHGSENQTNSMRAQQNSVRYMSKPSSNVAGSISEPSGWSGKSLEGSAVKADPDPLDMSEEAKAERWFKRVAQIKDISELSQIPDEDFPSIMPMRKGVNRFVVSKRKTPLERRLTSTQYRRNLPIVSSDQPPRNEGGDDSQ
ncbi:unnamed protein product [Linum trigynum]|uniref:RanBP2-type domain-containing protein n=1 Tax=Linum trigynum TaxID=586398 RepID=A0AAV2CL71_9ROSI